MNILMVCLGNICRSPLAEGVLKKYLPQNKFFIDSAGTASYHTGSSPDPRSVNVARKNNINITHLKARQFDQNDFKKFDHIYVMDRSNLKNISLMDKEKKYVSKVKLLIPENDVPDPYYGEEKDFDYCFKLIDERCKKISLKLINNA